MARIDAILQLVREQGASDLHMTTGAPPIVRYAVASLIREKKTFQLGSVIQTGKREGMQSMDESVLDLVREHVISPEEAALHLSNRDLLPVGGTAAAAAAPARPVQP